MKFNITQLWGRASAGLIAAVAAFSLSAAAAVIAPASAAAQPVQGVKKCTPGDIKVVKGTKYVCDLNGNWRHVKNFAAGSVVAIGGRLSISGVAPGGTQSGAFKIREANNGGDAGVTCGGGSKPGDYVRMTTTTFVNGKAIRSSTTTFICGKDGLLHELAWLASGPGIVAAIPIATVEVVRP